MKPDFAVVKCFLDLIALDSSDNKYGFRTLDDAKIDKSLTQNFYGTIEQVWNALAEKSARGAGVFVMVNKTDGRGFCASNVVTPRAVFVDSDNGDVEFKLPPNILSRTKRGVHGYYLVDSLTNGQYQELQLALIANLGTDDSVKDLPRIMRLPGFPHQKDRNNKFMPYIESHHDRRYTVDELFAAYPPKQKVQLTKKSALSRPAAIYCNHDRKLLPSKSLEPAIKKCAALTAALEAGRNGTATHEQGFALLSHVLAYSGGRDWFRNNVHGWDDTDFNSYQIDHFVGKGYGPYTCAKMQECGVCAYSNSQTCLLKKFQNGVLVEPNPIRFAYGATSRLDISGGKHE